MSNSYVVRSLVPCPRCGTINALIAEGVDDGQEVRCSHCGNRLGLFADLKRDERRYQQDSIVPEIGPD